MQQDLEKIPQEGRMNTPSSGTYGEKAEVDNLKKSLPSSVAPQSAAGPPAASPRSGGMPLPGRPDTTMARGKTPGGVPEIIARPTDRPDVPVNTPLGQGGPAQPAIGGAADPAQQRVALLDAIVRSQNVSEETREWAELVRAAMGL